MNTTFPRTPSRPARGCPICGRPASEDARPFCSARCKDIDLSRWLSGRYVIAGADTDDEDGKEPPAAREF